MLWERIERLLQVYSFEDILEENDLTVEEVLSILYDEGFISLPTEPIG